MQLTLFKTGRQEYLMTAGVAQRRRVTVVVRAPEVKAGKEGARRVMVSCGYAK
jgi:hypothetical protein